MTAKPTGLPKFETKELQWILQYLRHLEEESDRLRDRVDLLYERTSGWEERLDQADQDFQEIKPLLKMQDQFLQRTQMLLELVDRLQRQFGEVSARYQSSNDEMWSSVEAKLLGQQNQINNIHKDDAAIKTARITRVQSIVIALIVAAQTLLVVYLSQGQK